MPNIKDQKLLYHLTSSENLPSIFSKGLMSRSSLNDFVDVADHEILQKRENSSLHEFVPFHFFTKNPFDYAVQRSHEKDDFVLITVHRTWAAKNNWKVICRHPLANEGVEIHDYNDGMAIMNWELMNQRDYNDPDCKSVCMAECLSPRRVEASNFFKIFVMSVDVQKSVLNMAIAAKLNLDVAINENLFVGNYE